MRPLYFLVPGTTKKYASGGLWAELKTLALAQTLQTATLVTYRQREPEHPFLPELLATVAPNQGIFVVSWGFDVPHLLKKLRSHHVLYHSHSTGYGFRVPSAVPILAVSRNSLGYWGQHAPTSPLFHLPNEISPDFCDRLGTRDIDVLVQTRKTSPYVLQQLVPYLEKRCRVTVVDSFVDDLAALFNRSKIYLYDSAAYWRNNAVSEGFGLPPLEAIACGCDVFVSVNGALADYLDPGFNCQKISCYCAAYDGDRILNALETRETHGPQISEGDREVLLRPYRAARIRPRLHTILTEINAFFDYQEKYPPTITVPHRHPLLIWGKLELRKFFAQFKK